MYAIQNTETKQYLSLLSTPHFTDNKEIVSTWNSVTDAMIVTETLIDSTEGFEAFGMIDTQIIKLK